MVRKLVEVCEYSIANNWNSFLQTHSSLLILLPINVKARLFNLLAHRGLLTDESLPLLLNNRIRTFDFRDCPQISDQSLLFMVRYSTMNSTALNPLILHVRGTNFSDNGLIAFVRRFASLRQIRLHNCPQITDETVIAIGQHCLRLMEFDLTGCVRLTDQGIDALRHLTQLRSLAVSHTHLTDQSLISIGQSTFRQTLNEINLRGCDQITDDGFLFLLSHCPNLKTIGFIQCPQLTERSRMTLNSQTHQLSYLVWSIPV